MPEIAPLAPTSGTIACGAGLPGLWTLPRRAAANIEGQVRPIADRVFHVVAEHPKEKHVSQQVQPPGMQEHAA